jgi:RIO kinase 1
MRLSTKKPYKVPTMFNDEGLSRLVEDGIIDAVHSRLMSGKEATVYIVEREGHFGAAKVYKPRDERTFKKTASYTEGRNQTRNSRDRRAMHKKTAYGRGLSEEGWQDMEFQALRSAFDAGVRVPEPYNLYENILLMELVVDAQGAPAPRMADVHLTADEATHLHLQVFLQVKALLAIGRIHGDLSAYNVLMAAAGPTLIDMPQAVNVAGNNNARQILRRDLQNVTQHLARFDARLLRFADCGDILYRHLLNGTLDQVSGPEVGAPPAQGGGGHRYRDAERGRAGREKAQRPQGAAAVRTDQAPKHVQGKARERTPQAASAPGPRAAGNGSNRPGANHGRHAPGHAKPGTSPAQTDGRPSSGPANGGRPATSGGGRNVRNRRGGRY